MLLRSILTAACLAAAVIAAQPTAAAAEFNPKHVPADVKWVAHLDLRLAVNSEIGKLVLADLKAMGMDTKVRQIRAIFGIDPLTSFDSITLYGSSYAENDAVVVIEAVDDVTRLEELVEAGEEYQMTEHEGRIIHSWIETEGKQKGMRKYGTVDRIGKDESKRSLIVIANDRAKVTGLIDVIDGGKENLTAATEAPLTSRPDIGSILFVAADQVASAAKAKDRNSAIVRAAETMVADIGEKRGEVFMDVQLTTKTNAQAQNIRDMAGGILAAVSMSDETADTPLATLAEAVKVRAAENTILARFTYDAQPLYALLKRMREARQAEGNFAAPPEE